MTARNILMAAAGASPDANYIEDVFSTWLYTGNGSSQTINNGIDLAGKGGLVWIKNRTSAADNALFNMPGGFSSYQTIGYQSSNSTSGSLSTSPTTIVSTSSSVMGFGLNGSSTVLNASANNYASWTFRKQPKFFDVVTYTGNGATFEFRAHNLQSFPGAIFIKATSTTGDWFAWCRTSPTDGSYLKLNSTAAQVNTGNAGAWSDRFLVGTSLGGVNTNASGVTYVAYLFAHNAGGFGLSGTDNVISCGSYTGTGSNAQNINVGFEPQWVLIKRTDSGDNWVIGDTTRVMSTDGAYERLYTNLSDAESSINFLGVTSTGFRVSVSNNFETNASGGTYIYIAIRRGPMKVPTTGTSVFSPNIITTSTRVPITTGFPIDLQFLRYRDNASPQAPVYDRLRGVGSKPDDTFIGPQLDTTTTAAETTNFTTRGWGNTGFVVASPTNTPVVYWNFRRAPGFFDEVCYTGTGITRNVAHNLAAVPELVIIKCRSSAIEWAVHTPATGYVNYLSLNSTAASAPVPGGGGFAWIVPQISNLNIGGAVSVANQSGQTYVAYLFASCPGVSKVGSYTGNGTNQTINCGFTAGARFIMIKRTDSTGDWYIWDTARGIVTGNDPRLSLNTTSAEVTTDDSVDPASSGFIVNQLAATNINVTSATYIYLAIA